MTTTADPKPQRTPKLSGRTIAALLEPGRRITLVVHADGKLDTPDLADEALPATSRVVLDWMGEPCGRRWADGHLTLATDTAEEGATALGTLRAAAARLANDELSEAYSEALTAWQARQAAAAAAAAAVEVVPTPPASPVPAVLVPQQRRGGRHAAPLSQANREREEELRWGLVLEVLEVLDPAA